ncbi:type II toxin-antitoxin system PemK/MazF family toxin [Candidatus Woesearchaeota archaeon]|nr:type II toxin-antitoxin system PemK/MazF family toxin [Candidatus Woesearchaeota archaeon]
MKSGILFKQGEIVLVSFPFTDLTNTKQRPAVVISKNEYNNAKKDVIVCGITSQLKETKESILITNQDLEKGNLPKISLIKIDKIFTLDKNIFKRSLGEVKKETLQQVKQKFHELF